MVVGLKIAFASLSATLFSPLGVNTKHMEQKEEEMTIISLTIPYISGGAFVELIALMVYAESEDI